MSENFVVVGADIRTAISPDGESIRFAFKGNDGQEVGIEMMVGFLQVLVGKIMTAAQGADERRRSQVGAELMNAIMYGAAARNKELRVGKSQHGGVILQVQLSGLPLSLEMSKGEALAVARDLEAHAQDPDRSAPQKQ
ncbi:MAG: hypothetical protein J0I31_13770 [Rhizobiales bacterium]|nr:hypothetical protein [Hyphomicrobiales bacterium]